MNTKPNPEIFISYSRKDSKEVDLLINWLSGKGIESSSIFFDKENIHGAGNFSKVISDSIEKCKVLLFIVSKSSINSEWVKDEVFYALKSKKPVLPILIENVKMPGELEIKLSRFQWISIFEGDKESNYQNILYSLEQLGISTGEKNPQTKTPKMPIETWFNKNRKNLIWTAAIILTLLFLTYFLKDFIFNPENNSASIPDIEFNENSTFKSNENVNDQLIGDNLNEDDELKVSSELLTIYYSFHVRKGETYYEIFNNSDVQKGDSLKILIKSIQDSYLCIINVDATNKPYLIFPQNSRENILKANKLMSIPSETEFFLVDEISGIEKLYFITSKTPITKEVQDLINMYASNKELNQEDFNIKHEIQSRSLSEIVEDSDASQVQKTDAFSNLDVDRYFSGRGILVKEIRFNHI